MLLLNFFFSFFFFGFGAFGPSKGAHFLWIDDLFVKHFYVIHFRLLKSAVHFQEKLGLW